MNDAATLSAELRDLPRDRGYGFAALKKALLALDPLEADALSSAGRVVRGAADVAIGSWLELASRSRVPQPRLLRNLVALSPRADVPVYRVLLACPMSARLDADGQEAARTIVDLLGPAPSGAALLAALLEPCSGPTVGEFVGFFDDPVVALSWAACCARDKADVTIARLGKLLAGVAEHAAPERLPRLLELWWSRGGSPRLSLSAVNRLPLAVRRQVLALGVSGTSILEPTVRAAIIAEPLSHPDAPESVRRVKDADAEEAIARIARRDFSTQTLKLFRRADFTPEAEQRLWTALVTAPASPSPRFAAELDVNALLSDGEFGALLAFLAVPTAERLDLLPRQLARFASAIVREVSAAEWAQTLAAAPDRARELVPTLEAAGRRDVLESLVGAAESGHAGTSACVAAWGVENAEALISCLRSRQTLTALFAAEMPHKVLGAILPRVLTADAPRSALDSLPASSVRALHAQSPGVASRALAEVAAGLAAGDGAPLSAFASKLMEADEDLKLLGDVLASARAGEAAFQPVLETACATALARGCDRRSIGIMLRRCLDASIIRDWTAERERLPEPVRMAIVAAGDDVLRAGFRGRPAEFVEAALQKLPLESLLEVALVRRDAAIVLERRVPRDVLASKLDWVRERWSGSPSVAAAYELALAFSLPDAGFLVKLAMRARTPRSGGPRGCTFDSFYRTYELPKKSGGKRVITVPSPELKRFQRRLLDRGFARLSLHEAATGFRQGGSILLNARPHVGKRLVVNLDIKSFFPSTGYSLVVRACQRLSAGRLSRRAVMFLADLCSYRSGLPIGAPTSPAIGNLVLDPVDRVLGRFAARSGVAYTRYADDLTFSGPVEARRMIPFAARLLGRLGYTVEQKKVNLFRRGRRQVVTGLVVNDKPNLPRRTRRRLRAAVHRARTGRAPHWNGKPMGKRQLLGRIAFLGLVQPEESRFLREALGCAAAEVEAA